MMAKRNGSTWASRKLRAQVLREEPLCRIGLPGCTKISTQVDHILPWAQRPDLALVRANLQGACASCNMAKGSSPPGVLRAALERPALRFFGPP